jgi:hypothetical protein
LFVHVLVGADGAELAGIISVAHIAADVLVHAPLLGEHANRFGPAIFFAAAHQAVKQGVFQGLQVDFLQVLVAYLRELLRLGNHGRELLVVADEDEAAELG